MSEPEPGHFTWAAGDLVILDESEAPPTDTKDDTGSGPSAPVDDPAA